MPQYRKLFSKVTQSFDFNEMPNDFIRCLWLLLPLGLDSEGRGIYNASWIKAKLMPLRDDVDNPQILAAMQWFSERNMIMVYDVDGRSYFTIPTFKQYQSGTEKEARSILPAPPNQELVNNQSVPNQEQVSVAESAYESESESVIESDSLILNAQKLKPKIPTEMDVGRIFTQTTGMVSMPNCDQRGNYFEAIYQMLQTYGHDETLERMKAAYDAWNQKHTKDGRQYSKTNLAWINYAVAGEVPGGNGSTAKVKTVAEEIAEELSHDRQPIRR